MALIGAVSLVRAAPDPAAAPAASTATAIAPPAPIPLQDVSTEAVATVDNLREVSVDLEEDPVTGAIKREWPAFARELNTQLEESAKLLRAVPSLDNLRQQEKSLVRLTRTLDDWNGNLTNRATQLEKKLNQLERAQATWNLTLETALGPDVPAQVSENIRTSIDSLAQARNDLGARRREILGLQNRIAQDDRRLDSATDAVRQSRAQVFDRLFKRDSPPLWALKERSAAAGNASVRETQDSLATQLKGLSAYARRQEASFLLHFGLFAVLAAAAYWVRRRLHQMLKKDAALESALGIFNSPLSIALVISMSATVWIYPEPPRLLGALFATAAIIPAGFILRQLVGRHFLPVPTTLLIFYFGDQLRSLVASAPLPSRWALLIESAAALGFALWFARRLRASETTGRYEIRQRRLYFGVRVAAVALLAAIAGNILGYLNLSTLLANAALNGAYTAILIFATVRVLAVVTMVALRVPPLNLLRASRMHRAAVWRRAVILFRWTGYALWFYLTARNLAVDELLWNWGTVVMTTPLTVGAVSLTLGHLVAFFLTIWAAVLISRTLRFFLEQDVYSHFELAPGLPYAISKSLHYAILFGGFLMAVAALGFDMTKFTILVSAFGVGLGFGMQNILNNFASGLILLFERPIKVGDVIQMDDATGVIERIGIRATVLRTGNGSQVILPNGKLISDRVINWTFGSRQRIVQIPVVVPAGTDPQHVVALLKEVAAADPRISKTPPPQAVATKLSAAGFEFELRVWTNQIEDILQVRSDLSVAFNTALMREAVAAH